jgi:hypothetical protein
MLRKFDHFTIACITLLIIVAIAAVVILEDTHHSAEVRSAVIAVSTLLGSVATIASVQSVRNGVGRTNNSIENGVLKEKVKTAVAEYMDGRARQFTQNPEDNQQPANGDNK